METIIRIMANNRTYDEQTNLVERLHDAMEFVGLLMASATVLGIMALA